VSGAPPRMASGGWKGETSRARSAVAEKDLKVGILPGNVYIVYRG